MKINIARNLAAQAALKVFLWFPALAMAAVPWDSALLSAPATEVASAAAAVKVEKAADVVVLLDEQRLEFDASHRVVRTRRFAYRVDTSLGVEQWGSIAEYWQPWHQQRPQVRARVITADGKEHLLDSNLLSDAPMRNDVPLVYDDAHIYQGPLPAVAIGAVIEGEVTIVDNDPFFAGGSVYRIPLGRTVPVLRTRVTLAVPTGLPLRYKLHKLPEATVKEVASAGRTNWVIEQGPLQAIEEIETNLPGDMSPLPLIEISTGASWRQVAQSYLEATELKIRIEEVVPLLDAREPAGTALDIARRVVARLHREVRYTGIEFGESRLIPRSPAETLKQKFGDCKDKSVVLAAMLRASGVPAYLALIAAGDGPDVTPELPGLGSFNHMIVYVPGTADLWIDATAEFARVGDLPPGTRGRLALIVRDGEAALVRTPESTSSSNFTLSVREFHLAENGPARIVSTTELRGAPEIGYRALLSLLKPEQVHELFEAHVQESYLAEALSRYDTSRVDALDNPLTLRLEVDSGKRGFTGVDGTASVAIPITGIADGLPASLYMEQRNEDMSRRRASKAAGPETARTTDIVFEPFSTEWRYRISLPPGYRVKSLPSPSAKELGPARLSQQFAVESDGTVGAILRFDSVKGRYTVAEAEATREALKDFLKAPPLILAFELTAQARLAAGDMRGALQSYSELVELHPSEALHHVHIANTLLTAGLAERAKREAETATKVEPGSALAWSTLGWVLQHDMAGRRFGKWFDYNGAIEAYRKAQKLDPGNVDITRQLAGVLERDAQGVRYSPQARLDDAAAEYRKYAKSAGEKDQDTFVEHLAYVLFHAGHIDEALDALPPTATTGSQRTLLIAALAAQKDAAAGIDESFQLNVEDTERGSVLLGASQLLAGVRRYALAADILAASVTIHGNSVTQQLNIDLLRAAKPHEQLAFSEDDPCSLAQRLLIAALRQDDRSTVLSLASRHWLEMRGKDQENIDTLLQRLSFPLRNSRLSIGAVADAWIDVVLASVTCTPDTDDAGGYRLRIRSSTGLNASIFVVMESGRYRFLTTDAFTRPLGTLSLARLATGDLQAARRWLDWGLDVPSPTPGDDPLGGAILPRFWKRGQDANRETIEIAAAALAGFWSVDVATKVLRGAREQADDDLNINLALASIYMHVGDWQRLREVGERLLQEASDSGTAYMYVQSANSGLKRWSDMEDIARARQARLPDDKSSHYSLAYIAVERGQYETVLPEFRAVLGNARATANDYSSFAWFGLVTSPITQETVDAARSALGQSQSRSRFVFWTAAYVYAAFGKVKEARELLLQAMQLLDVTESNSELWYGMGLIAEACGDSNSALRYHERVEKPGSRETVVTPTSVYTLAQQRLATLREDLKNPRKP